MKFNKWTIALAATGVVSLAGIAQAEESHPVNTALSSTTLSGFVDTSAIWTSEPAGLLRIASPTPGRTVSTASTSTTSSFSSRSPSTKAPGAPATRPN